MSVHQTPDGRWFVRFQKGKIPGEPNKTREYFGRGPDAETRARARNQELGLGRIAAVSGKVFRDLALYYLESRLDKMEERSVSTAHSHATVHLIPYFADTDVLSITEDMLDGYVARRRKAEWRDGAGQGKIHIGVSRSTIKRELTTMQAILNFAVKRKVILYNPVAHYDMPKQDDAVIAPATQEEVVAILRVSPPHLQRFIMLAWYTAVRPGYTELLTLRWDQIDFAGKTVFIRSAKKGGLVSRKIPMHPELEASLLDWYEHDRHMTPMPTHIIHYHGEPVKKVGKAWAAAKKRAKVLRRLPAYSIRHSAITQMLESGADLKSVSLIAGHASPAMTMRRYQHSSTRLQELAISGLVTVGHSQGGKNGSQT